MIYGLLAAVATGLSVFLLVRVDWPQMARLWHSVPTPTILAAVLAVCVSYRGLAADDVVAVRHLNIRNISPLRAASAGAVSYGIAKFVGLPWLTGGAVRGLFYRGRGVSVGALMLVVMASWVGFWLAVAGITGAMLALRPEIVAAYASEMAGRALGIALLAAVMAGLIWLAQGRALRIGRQTFRLPGRRMTLLQMAAALVDLTASAGVLYLFLPPDLAPGLGGDFAGLFCLFVLAVGVGILSHIPAGVGAFDGAILLGLHSFGRADVGAALLTYRLLRTVLPFRDGRSGAGRGSAARAPAAPEPQP